MAAEAGSRSVTDPRGVRDLDQPATPRFRTRVNEVKARIEKSWPVSSSLESGQRFMGRSLSPEETLGYTHIYKRSPMRNKEIRVSRI